MKRINDAVTAVVYTVGVSVASFYAGMMLIGVVALVVKVLTRPSPH